MDVDAQFSRLGRGQTLSQQAGDDAGQDIARTACRHAVVAARVDVMLILMGNHSPGILHDKGQIRISRAERRRPQEVRFYFRQVLSQKTRQFFQMRGKDAPHWNGLRHCADTGTGIVPR